MTIQMNRLAYLGLFLFLLIGCDKTADDEIPVVEPEEENLLQPFDLLYVPNGGFVNLKPTLVWEVPYSEDGSDVTYTILMDKMVVYPAEELPTTVLATGLTSNVYTLTAPLDLDEFYHWYVIADSDSGSTRKSMSDYYFVAGIENDNQPPGAFNLISPNDDIIPINTVVSFFWEEPQDIDGHETEYIFFHRQDSFQERTSFGVLPNGINEGNVSIHNNNIPKTCEWRILAVDMAGNARWSNNTLSYTVE